MDFNYEPFWDDFEASNGAREENYMKILFRPGYAVQARELTQIQSILQNQIKQFGNHVFKNGSQVYGGQMTFDKAIRYLKLEPTYNFFDIDVTDYLDRVIFNQSGTAKKRAKVVAVYDSLEFPTLMIRMLTGNDFVAGDLIGTSTGSLATVAPDPTGIGSVAHIDEGIFYANGYFVYVAPQTLVLDAYSSLPTYKVGLEIAEEVMDESGDANLLDPAQSSFNYQAPGAHRYKFSLTLAKRALDSTDEERFFEILRVENGNITKLITQTQYAAFESLLARRTYDESGNYVVRPFTIELSANTADDTNFIARIGSGKAYVAGYDYESNGLEQLTVNKARNYQNIVDYDLAISYGNYIITTDMKVKQTPTGGLPDFSSIVSVDMHCVTADKISYASAGAYKSTLVGSSKMINLERSGVEYVLYFSEIGVSSNTFVTTDAAGSTSTLKFPSPYSTQTDAYKGVSVRILSGSAYNDIRTVTSYDGATRIATVDSAFTAIISSGVTVELFYDKVNINSIVEAKSDKSSANLTMNVSSRSKVTGTTDTKVGDSKNSCLIFPLSDKYVKYNSVYNADYYFKKYIPNKEFLTNGTTCSASFTFNDGVIPFGAVAGTIASTVSLSDYLIVLNKTTGLIIASADLIVTVISTTEITITVTGATGFYSDVYITLKADNSENFSKRTKVVVGDSTTTKLSTGQIPSGTTVNGQASVMVNQTNGFIWFTDASIINKSLGGATSLYIPDVFKIKAIYDSQDSSLAPTLLNSIDITDRFLLDSGQRDMYYEHSSIVLKPGATPPSGQIVVLTQYFKHSTTPGYFCVSSYSEQVYTDGSIPVYYSAATGLSYSLRDSIDFRPSRSALTTANTFNGFKCVNPNLPMELSYAYYLPRIDSVVVTTDRSLKVVEGAPARVPIPPSIPSNAMELFQLKIPSYTPNVASVRSVSTQSRRFTMKDIGDLEVRINQLEYYTAMSLVEKVSTQQSILYTGTVSDSTKIGAEKEKYGMLVDNFVNFNSADTYKFDFLAAVDGGVLTPICEINSFDMNLQPYDINSISVNDKTITLPYTETACMSQLVATSNISVQPYLYGTFEGILKVSPEVDTTHSFTLPPIVVEDKNTIIVKPVESIVSSKMELTETKKNIIKNHMLRWANIVNKNYIAISQTYNDEAYDSSPNQTIRNL